MIRLFSREIHLSWIVLAFGMICIFVFQALPGPKPLDDAYITFRYARNISQGLGYVYNPGEQVQGTTTPLYTLILAFFAWLFGADHLVLISFYIALAADSISIWLFFRITRSLLGNVWAASGATLVLLFQPLRINVASSGMETSLFLFFLLGMFENYVNGKKMGVTAIWAALALLTRLDAVLAILPIFIYALWKERWSAVKVFSKAGALILPWFLWATWYFGNPIPQSIIAKKSTYDDMDPASTVIFLLNFVGTGLVGPFNPIYLLLPGLIFFISTAGISLFWLVKNRRVKMMMVILYPLLYYVVMSILHVPVFFIWYYVPLMPGFLLLIFSGAAALVHERSFKIQLLAFSTITCGLILVPTLLMSAAPGWAVQRQSEAVYQSVCDSLSAANQPGKTILAPDIGVIGWRLDKSSIVDPVGLVSPLSIQFRQEQINSNLITTHMVSSFHPDYIITPRIFIQKTMGERSFQAEYRFLGNFNDVLVYERR
jgi:arabinofuranosyltransferase